MLSPKWEQHKHEFTREISEHRKRLSEIQLEKSDVMKKDNRYARGKTCETTSQSASPPSLEQIMLELITITFFHDPGNRARSSAHKLKSKELQLNMRETFFMLRVAEHWNRLPRVINHRISLSEETFKTPLDVFLCNLL